MFLPMSCTSPLTVASTILPFEDVWARPLGACGCRSLLAVPLDDPRVEEGGGLVLVGFAEPRTFVDDDLELARHVGDAARGALERSGLFEAERTARALAQQLARTGGLLATELDPAAVLDEVVQQAPALLGAEACVVRVLEDDLLVVSAAEGADVGDLIGEESPATGRLSGDVVQSRAPIVVDDTNPPGDTIANLFGSHFSDIDAPGFGGSFNGIAVIADGSTTHDSFTMMPRSTTKPESSASEIAGRTPMPTTIKSACSVSPFCNVTFRSSIEAAVVPR